MDTNHGAAGDPPDDDVFGPLEDGEEVFEWIDDWDGEGDPDDPADKQPSPTLRERLAALHAGGQRLRHSRGKIAGAAAAVVLACGIGGGCTAWFDGVAGAADRAGVVSLAVDSVVDGDPAAASYNAADTSATGEYVVEFANNGPDAVTLASVGVDAGILMTSTGWQPVGGSARIKGGGTGKVVLTVKLSCPLMIMGMETGAFGAGGADARGSSMPFPSVDVQVRDANGDQRGLVLPTRVTVASQAAADTGRATFLSGGAPTPQIVTADAGACGQWEADRADQSLRSFSSSTTAFRSGVSFTYDKVLSPAAGKAFTLGFTVKNTTDHPENLTARNDQSFADASPVRTEWLPSPLRLGPGQSAPARLTVHVNDCTGVQPGGLMSSAPVLGLTMLEVDDPAGGASQPVFLDQALTGSLRLAGDLAQQEKAACP